MSVSSCKAPLERAKLEEDRKSAAAAVGLSLGGLGGGVGSAAKAGKSSGITFNYIVCSGLSVSLRFSVPAKMARLQLYLRFNGIFHCIQMTDSKALS